MTSFMEMAWALFGVLVLGLLGIDLLVHRNGRGNGWGSALAWSIVWIGFALLFNLGVWHFMGGARAEEFLGAYLLEKTLSVDNLFVFLILFRQLGVSKRDERKILFWGVLGAFVLRGIFIGLGSMLVERWHFVLEIFGIVLVATAIKMFVSKHDAPGEGRMLRVLRRFIPSVFLLAIIAVELTDVMFAIDSIPAAFAVTDSPFIIYTSNVLALLGLRSLYVVLARALEGLKYLKPGLAVVLALAGVKMLVGRFWHPDPLLSVVVIAGVMTIAIVASVLDRHHPVGTSHPGS